MTETTGTTLVPRAIWHRMAAKATREDLRAYRLNGDRRSWAVTSRSNPASAYEVIILDGDLLCSCRGSEFYPYCKHRALVLRELGMLDAADGRTLDAEAVIAALRAA